MTDYLISDIPVTDNPSDGKVVADITLSNISVSNSAVTADTTINIRELVSGQVNNLSGSGVTLANGGGGGVTVTFTNNRVTNLVIEYADDPDAADWQTLTLSANTTKTVTMGIGYYWFEDSSFQPDTYTGMSYDNDLGLWVISGEASATWTGI